MYYDPMISKLITWGKDRKTALDLLGKAIDEYVIRGVVHNLGFGQSILRNKSFAEGHYSTAFIPTYYPNGFKGDPLTTDDQHLIALSSHFLRNHTKGFSTFVGQEKPAEDGVVYVSLKDGDHDHDYRVERKACGSFELTDVSTGKAVTLKADNFTFEYGSLLRFKVNGQDRLIQYEDTKEEVNYHFAVKGSQVEATVLDEAQYRLKKYMAPPKKIDHAKSVLSPMPGAIVSIAVEVGQTVTEGQELFTIEAMKMQNLIKSQVEGKIKKIHVKAGVSVSVDQLLIEYE
jgi:propionyl-CoA carboxylase alpha chain